MNNSITYALYGTVAGVLGTGIGATLAYLTKKSGNRFLSSILEYCAGLMITVVLLDLLPEAFNHTSLILVLTSVILGLALMFLAEFIMNRTHRSYKHMGIVMALGIGIHNFPEGLAIGAGFDTSFALGISLVITIMLHDIPEGIAMSIPLKLGGISMLRAVFIAGLSGLPMGLGALVGSLVGNISQETVGICLGIASGAMLYIALTSLIPESKKIYKGRLSSWFNILGIITGIIISKGL